MNDQAGTSHAVRNAGRGDKWRLSCSAGVVSVVVMASVACSRTYLADYKFHGQGHRQGPGSTVDLDVDSSVSGIGLSDEHLQWAWTINDYRISVEVTNQSSSLIRLLWGESGFSVDSGDSQPLYVTQGRITARGDPVGLVEVAPHQHAEFDMYPRNYMGDWAGWTVPRRAVFDPPGFLVGHTPEEIIGIAQPAVGKTIRIKLPVVLADSRFEYDFAFTVAEVRARPKRLL
ncbi:MAG TPA: hypothetical protein VJS92_15125 [Candidatus Polarisedimenticolaceae bacterium]|nr:hypothetical protein [Candidatus Polarisedimenticolaceae bacterium]